MKAVGVFNTRAYNASGLCPNDEPISSKPFLLTFNSAFLKSSKNAFTVPIPGVSSKFKKPAELKKRKESFNELNQLLTGFIEFGPRKNLRLALVVTTSKSTSPVLFIPITNCAVVGFGGNGRKSAKFRSVNQKKLSLDGTS